MAAFKASVLLGFAFVRSVEAWGQDGHTIVAHVADALLDPEVSKVLLADLGKESLSAAATWCDDFDHTPAGRWSAPLHYINYPGHACSFDWSRDCVNDYCNVGAIVNYSKQVWDKTISSESRLIALKFMIHLMGDLHQPLHVASADDLGGNTIHIEYKFNSRSSEKKFNLHQIWDDAIVIQMIDDISASPLKSGPFPFHNWQVVSDELIKHVKGDWSSNTSEWRSTVAEKKDETTFRKGLSVVAGETSALSCSYAYVKPDGSKVAADDVLDVAYYQRSKPVVAMQLAKGGARLAQILSDSLAIARAKETVMMI